MVVSWWWRSLGIFLMGWLTTGAYAQTSWKWNMPYGVTPLSREIFHLHMTIFWICVAIGVVVFGVMLYTLIFHRKSRGAVPSDFHEHPVLEVVWMVIPFLILVAMAIPATRVLMAMEDNSEADITIKVTGYQWKWKYDYLDQGISFFSNLATPYDQIQNKRIKNRWYLLEVDNPVVVPINKKIRFLTTAADVLHSWWVPQLGIKKDAIPGFIHESWARIDTIGTYRGQCAELCGINHAYMPIVVKAVSNAEFEQWVAEQKGPPPVTEKQTPDQAAKPEVAKPVVKTWDYPALMAEGKKVYEKLCVACHKADGTGQPPIFPPLKASSIAVGKPLERHIDNILWGVDGTAMQSFAPQLSDEEIAAVVTYERNAWGNNTGDVVLPKAVTERRGNKKQ